MIIRTIIVMSFSILQHCCTQNSLFGFRHFQPKSVEDLCLPAWKIHGRPVEDPRHLAQLYTGVCVEQPLNSSEKLSFPCYVLYEWEAGVVLTPLSHGTLNLDCPIHMRRRINGDSIPIESDYRIPVLRWIISGFCSEIVQSRSQAPENVQEKMVEKGRVWSDAETKLLLEIWSQENIQKQLKAALGM